MHEYTQEQVITLLDQACNQYTDVIVAGLYGADTEQRLSLLDQLDVVEGVRKQLRIIISNTEETSE